MQFLTGSNTWSRLQARVGVGKRIGPVMLSGRGAAFGGHSLNIVSAFLIGGSWDLASPELMVGYRYAELRLDRAARSAERSIFACVAHGRLACAAVI